MPTRLAFALPLALIPVASLWPQQRTPDGPRAVVRAALRAVEGDSAAPLRIRWLERARRDAGDREAALGLATLARLTYDTAAAKRLYQPLAADTLRPDGYAIRAQLGLGNLLDFKQSTEAGIYYERARRMAHAVGDVAAEAEALAEAAFVRSRTQNAQAALAALDSAAALAPHDALVEARVRAHRARLIAVGRAGEVMAEARAAIAAAKRAGDPRTEAYALNAIVTHFTARLDRDSGLVYAARAESLQRRVRDRHGLAMTLLRVGQLHKFGSDLNAARSAVRRAQSEADASHYSAGIAIANTALGTIAKSTRDFPGAMEHLRRAVAMFEQNADSANGSLARGALAHLAIDVGDLTLGRRLLMDVLAWNSRLGVTVNHLQGYRQLSMIARFEGNLPESQRWLDSARAAARALKSVDWERSLLFDEGNLALARRDYPASERLLADYLSTLDSSQVLGQHEVRERLAYSYMRRGDLARAEREMIASSDALDRFRATLNDSALRVLGLQTSTTDIITRDGMAAWVLGALAQSGRAEAALQIAERRRARNLLDQLAQGGALQHAPAAPGLRQAAAWRAVGAPSVRETAAAIPDDRIAMVEYVVARGAPTTAFILTRAGVRTTRLPPIDSLAGDVQRLIALLEADEPPGVLARTLGERLLQPVVAVLPAAVTRLVIVPDGVLHRLPFDVLQLADGRAAVERFAIGTAPSMGISAVLWRREARAKGAPPRVLAFGDPAFAAERTEANASGDVYRSAFDSAGGLARLGASGGEARMVARYAPASVVRLRRDASAAWLARTSLDSFAVLHFATHALVDERTLARTALALAPDSGTSGFVTPGDLAALKLDADLVVLSACRTAGGTLLTGEGVQGLTAPLLRAGARAVVATSWRIGDRSTVRFVRDFYDALADSLPVGDALRRAKLAAIARGAPPSEWAAFQVIGDPMVRIALRKPAPEWRGWLLGGVALALLGGIVLLVARRRGGARPLAAPAV